MIASKQRPSWVPTPHQPFAHHASAHEPIHPSHHLGVRTKTPWSARRNLAPLHWKSRPPATDCQPLVPYLQIDRVGQRFDGSGLSPLELYNLITFIKTLDFIQSAGYTGKPLSPEQCNERLII